MRAELPDYESCSNLSLLDNGLRHVSFELRRESPSFFRVGRECHLVLLRAMVEALRGSANLDIVGRSKDKHRVTWYRLGDGPWQEIRKETVPGCREAWRYSTPKVIPAPTLQRSAQEPNIDEYLLGFYELVAKVQADCFMSRRFGASPGRLSDSDLACLEWLHERVRNEFEHFVPKSYAVGVQFLLSGSLVALRLSHFLLFESGAALLLQCPEDLQARLHRLVSALARLAKQT